MKSFRTFISEDFFTGFKGNGGYNEVLVNPTPKELRQFEDEYVRYIIDLVERKIYVWGGDGMIHYDMIRFLQKNHNVLMDLPIPDSEQIRTFDKYIQGVVVGTDNYYSSDLLEIFSRCEWGGISDTVTIMREATEVDEKFQSLLNMDLSWLDRYPLFKSDKIKSMISYYYTDFRATLEAYGEDKE